METSTVLTVRASVCKPCRTKDKATLNRQAKTENDELLSPQAAGRALLSPVCSSTN